jgi:hypothetical protein
MKKGTRKRWEDVNNKGRREKITGNVIKYTGLEKGQNRSKKGNKE